MGVLARAVHLAPPMTSSFLNLFRLALIYVNLFDILERLLFVYLQFVFISGHFAYNNCSYFSQLRWVLFVCIVCVCSVHVFLTNRRLFMLLKVAMPFN